jgi:spore coat protein U-like protein
MTYLKSVRSLMLGVVIGCLALGLASIPAVASTVQGTIAVSANVVANCTITTAALPFGQYSGAAINASTNITVTCSNLSTYTVGLDTGKTSGATETTRQMNISPSTAGALKYSLLTGGYSGSGSSNWGNVTGTWVSGTGTGNAQTLTVYGVLPANQFVPVGSYTDTITATVTY